mmetsp:Transcript_4796/g.8684  ORF Transcript_4796/g.8684 Transcript_4796/m.8684 type:complete len:203 (-) Transcript_4796:953-1561(-)
MTTQPPWATAPPRRPPLAGLQRVPPNGPVRPRACPRGPHPLAPLAPLRWAPPTTEAGCPLDWSSRPLPATPASRAPSLQHRLLPTAPAPPAPGPPCRPPPAAPVRQPPAQRCMPLCTTLATWAPALLQSSLLGTPGSAAQALTIQVRGCETGGTNLQSDAGRLVSFCFSGTYHGSGRVVAHMVGVAPSILWVVHGGWVLPEG